jgi:hypothetical protein
MKGGTFSSLPGVQIHRSLFLQGMNRLFNILVAHFHHTDNFDELFCGLSFCIIALIEYTETISRYSSSGLRH